ncbi:MAG: GNAT family N-acetyltransferase [Pseudomonadota bacterium]
MTAPQTNELLVRLAKQSDVSAATNVLRRSITDLCHQDHVGDPETLDRWLANKTFEQVHQWINADSLMVYVAEIDSAIAGIGALSTKGVVLLNYVDPGRRFQGVSSALLATMEADAANAGLALVRLESTKTAEQFYRARGYDLDPTNGAPDHLCMSKRLEK